MKDIKFKRKYYIKDLFNPTQILEKFDLIKFESLKAFSNAYQNGLLKLNNNIHIIIKSKEEYETMVKLMEESTICEKADLSLHIPSELLIELTLSCKKHGIFTDIDFTGEPTIFPLEWVKHNPLWIEVWITYDNYVNMIQKIIQRFNQQSIRFFDIHFDYESFEQMTFEELHKFEFHLNQLINWIISSGNKEKYGVHSIVTKTKGYIKEIFVSDDLKLYLNQQAYEDEDMLLDLWKWGVKLIGNGHFIGITDLNRFRKYLDMRIEFIRPLDKRTKFLDFYQNKKIMGEINELSWIMIIIGEKFERVWNNIA